MFFLTHGVFTALHSDLTGNFAFEYEKIDVPLNIR